MIKVQAISKSFGTIQALNNVSFNIKKGEIFGFLGPNGAGKSTTINILNTLLSSDTGQVLINGLDLQKDKEACKRLIGVVPQEIALYEDLSAYDNLLFWGGLYGVSKQELVIKADETLKMVGLYDRKDDAISTFSGGMKRRINIASALLHNPKVLLMDEPTVGVDPQSRNHIFDVIEKLNKEGMTIIYTTHYMEEAERLCDTIAIIDKGQIIAKGTLEELRINSHSKDVLSIKTAILNKDQLAKLKASLTFVWDKNLQTLKIECDNISNEISSIIKTIQDAHINIQQIDTQMANLEAIFLKLTGTQLRD